MRIKQLYIIIALLCYGIPAMAQNVIPEYSKDTDTITAVENQTTRKINPWQQAKGEILLSPYLSYYQATAFRDDSGVKKDFENNGKFSNLNPRLYFSLPLLSDRLNVFGSIPYFANKFDLNFDLARELYTRYCGPVAGERSAAAH